MITDDFTLSVLRTPSSACCAISLVFLHDPFEFDRALLVANLWQSRSRFLSSCTMEDSYAVYPELQPRPFMKTKIATFYRAFSILLTGARVEIGRGHIWKSRLLAMAIIGLAICPTVNTYMASPYQGASPPAIPLISAYGKIRLFHEIRGPRNLYYLEFITEEGEKYEFQDNIPDILSFITKYPDETFRVEGFILKNGHGRFWPTSVRSINGSVLLTPKRSERYLTANKDVWGEKLFFEYFLLTPIFIISFFNVLQIARKLDKGEIR